MAPLVDLSSVNIEEGKNFTLKWVDEARHVPIWEEGADEDDLINLQNPSPIKHHRENRQTKSAIKGTKLKQ